MAVCGAVLTSGTALAQTATQTADGGTNGIKMGAGRLHVSANGEMRYDSAAAFVTQNSATGLRLGSDFITRIGPGLSFELPTESVDFRVAGNLDYVAYTGLLSPAARYANRLEAAADLGLVANRGGPLEVQLTDTFSRSDRTRNMAIGFGMLSLGNTVQLRMPVRPGQGALEITPEAGYGLEYYSPFSAQASGCTSLACDPAQVARYNYQNLHGGLEGRWRFLPRTVLVLNTTFDHRFFPDSQGASPSVSMLQSMAGVSGLLTQRLALSLRAGWAFNLGTLGGNTFVGGADLSYPLSTTSMVRGGYERSFQPVGVYRTYSDDHFFAEGRVLLAGRLNLQANASLDFLGFSARADNAGTPRNDMVIGFGIGPQYQFTPWLVGSVGYSVGVRSSSEKSADPRLDSLNFTRHEGYFRLTTSY